MKKSLIVKQSLSIYSLYWNEYFILASGTYSCDSYENSKDPSALSDEDFIIIYDGILYVNISFSELKSYIDNDLIELVKISKST